MIALPIHLAETLDDVGVGVGHANANALCRPAENFSGEHWVEVDPDEL